MFLLPDRSVHISSKNPISQEKLEKGDARFNTEKEILGLMLNGAKRTVRPIIRDQGPVDRRGNYSAPLEEHRLPQAIPILARPAPA
jgi:hypothetical protein